LSERQSLSVLFLVDTSQSLSGTDPASQRVDGLRSAYGTLVSIASTPTDEGGQVPDVFVDFADFGTTTRRSFAERTPWASAGEADDVERIANFARRNRSQDTDYVAALEPWVDFDAPDRPSDVVGALEILDQAPADSCRSLVWFTDGQFDIDFQGDAKLLNWIDPPFEVSSESSEAQAELRGIDRLCRVGGLADRLRSGTISDGEGVYVTVVALGDSANFDLIRSIVAGTGSVSCGAEAPRGEVLDADSLGELIYTLTVGANPQSSVVPDNAIPTCKPASGDGTLASCELAFQLAPTISRVLKNL